MRFVRVAAFAVMPSLALLTTTAFAATGCWYPNEAKAAQLRDFHSSLMVGTLQCRMSNPEAVSRYNDFVVKQRGLLDANAQILKAHFVRENGVDAQGAYDRYATALANEQSKKHVDQGLCATVDMYVRTATSASHPDLLVMAQSLSQAPASSATCPPSSYTSYEADKPKPADVTVAPTAAVEAKPAEAVVMADAPADPAGVVVVHRGVTAAEPVAVAATPAAAEAAPAAAAAPATASREDALQAAVVALQAAATALQAASASDAPAKAAAATDAKPVQTVSTVKVEDAPVVPPKEETKP